MKKTITLLCAALALSACVATPPPEQRRMSFDNVAPVHLDVGSIEILNRYNAPGAKPNVDHLFPVRPEDAAHELVSHALVADGYGRILRVIIEDASVINTDLPLPDSLVGSLSGAPSNRYDAKVALRFEMADPAAPDIVTGTAEVIAKRSRTLMNTDSPADRDRAAFQLTEALMKDVEDGLRTVVKNTFGKKQGY